MTGDPAIELATAEMLEKRLDELAELLLASVHAGASVGFVLPFGGAAAAAFWRERVRPGVAAGTTLCWLSLLDGRLAGTVQLEPAAMPNQPHRADVKKLLVHPDYRRRGVARALMAVLEAHAMAVGRRLLTLDTRTGDVAEPLYASLGYAVAGVIPGYCRDPFRAEKLDATTIMYKAL